MFLKGSQINLKILVVEFIFWQRDRPRASNLIKNVLKALSKDYAQNIRFHKNYIFWTKN